MIFAAIPWLDISIRVLIVVFIIVCLLMGLLILMQRPKQEGLGAAFGGGVTDQVFGARTTNVLQKGTVYLGSLFFILSLTLAILIGKQTKQKSLVVVGEPVAEKKAEVEEEKMAVEEEALGSLVDELELESVPAPPASVPAEDAAEAAAEAVKDEAAEEAPAEENNADKPE